jgi:hypothetical protein
MALFAKNVTVPVGPAPPLVVATVAVSCTLVVVVGVVVFAETYVVVGAAVTVKGNAADELAL